MKNQSFIARTIKLSIVTCCVNLFASNALNAATLTVDSGGDVQAALNAAQCGDTIVLQAGAVFTLPTNAFYTLPRKPSCAGTDADYITITTSNTNGISPEGTRINPAVHAAAMAKIVGSNYPAIQTAPGAHHYKLVGLEITSSGSTYTPDLVQIGGTGSGPGGYATRSEMLELTKITIDRCFIHPAEISAANLATSSLHRSSGRGVHFTGTHLTLSNSWIGGFTGYYPGTMTSIDSYGVYMDSGLGPLTIHNNYIEANFNNIFIGGSDPPTPNTATLAGATPTQATFSNVSNLAVNDLVSVKQGGVWKAVRVSSIAGAIVAYSGYGNSALTGTPDVPGEARWKGDLPRDIVITRNTLQKRADWVTQGLGAQAKGFVEVKDGDNVRIDGNRMITTYPTTLALTNRNQNGSAVWSVIHNLTVSNNHISGWGAGAIIVGVDNEKTSSVSSQIVFRNNLFDAPGPYSYNFLFATEGGYDFTFSHNTFINTNGNSILFGVRSMNSPSVTFKDNIAFHGAYGLNCQVSPYSAATCWPGFTESRNAIVDAGGHYNGAFPQSTVVPNIAAVGFVNAAGGNYRLSPDSQFRNAASDGTDVGVNIDQMNEAMSGQQQTLLPPSTPSNLQIVQQ
ncbi:MAG TPA: right-handed parallel beta-helix repeat-containing protein [Vicinamibacterales bacterium]|nr:right-handed parallel beta-helix repeat-containing protein [Vicinamibacterales bacterium]